MFYVLRLYVCLSILDAVSAISAHTGGFSPSAGANMRLQWHLVEAISVSPSVRRSKAESDISNESGDGLVSMDSS